MLSSRHVIRLIKIAALVLGGLVVVLLVGAAIYVSTWGPTLPPETDETIQRVRYREGYDKEVFMERTEDALEIGADIIATACPYCMVMMTDGLKYKNKEEEISNYDIAELVAQNLGL